MVAGQQPRPVEEAGVVQAREVLGGGEARGGEWERLQVPALWGRAEELPGDHPRAAHSRHRFGAAGSELRALAAARPVGGGHHRERRPVQSSHFKALHHSVEAERRLSCLWVYMFQIMKFVVSCFLSYGVIIVKSLLFRPNK